MCPETAVLGNRTAGDTWLLGRAWLSLAFAGQEAKNWRAPPGSREPNPEAPELESLARTEEIKANAGENSQGRSGRGEKSVAPLVK